MHANRELIKKWCMEEAHAGHMDLVINTERRWADCGVRYDTQGQPSKAQAYFSGARVISEFLDAWTFGGRPA